MDKPSAYKGNDPYVFVCYAHDDADQVYTEISWLQSQGVNVWYDEGISPGAEWTEGIAEAIEGCATFVFFVTPSSVTREHCRRELNFAQTEGSEVMAVHLSPTEVPAGLRLSLNNRQAIFKHDLAEPQYRQALLDAVDAPSRELQGKVETRTSSSSPRWAIYAVAALLIVIAAGWWLRTPVEPPPAEPDNKVQSASEVLHNSIAVLPFENLSPDPDNAYFAAGIHEEILNQLVRINDLSVIARTSVLHYANVPKPISQIADELNVSNILEGSVRYAGDRVRIVAQLVEPKSGVQLWSEIYERKLEDVFRIQQDIALSIAAALEAELSQAEEQALSMLPTSNPDAYKFYIRALARFGSLGSIEPMIEDLRRAIALDEEFAEALALLSYLYAHRIVLEDIEGSLLTPESQRRDADLAADVARQALGINADLGRAYQALAYVDFYERRIRGAEENMRRSVEVAPNDRLLAHEYGYQLVNQGSVVEGIAYVDHAISLDPQNWVLPYYAARVLAEAYVLEESNRMARRVIEVEPDLPMGYLALARASIRQEDRTLALDMVANAERLGLLQAPQPIWLVWLLEIYSLLERPADVDRILGFLINFEPAAAINAQHWFFIHMALHDYESALDDLHQVLDDGFPEGLGNLRYALLYLSDTPYFDAIREIRRFQEALNKVWSVPDTRSASR